MTRTTARQRLARRMGNRTDFSTATGSDADVYLDAGLLELCTRRGIEINELRSAGSSVLTSIGAPSVSRPAGIFALRLLEDVTNLRVYRRFNGGLFEFLQAKQSASTGPSYQFVEDGALIYLFPIPDGVFTLIPYVYNYPTWGTDPTNEPNIDKAWHEGALIVAAELAFRDYGAEELATAAQAEYSEWLGMRDTAFKRSQRAETPLKGIQPKRDMVRWPPRGR